MTPTFAIRRLILLACLALAIPVQAQLSGSDNFNDSIKDTAKWGADMLTGGASFMETNSRLEYRVTTPDGDFDEALRPWILNSAPNSDTFEVTLDVFNNVSPSGSNNASIGLAVTSLENGEDSIFIELFRGGPSSDGKGFLAALSSAAAGGEVLPYTLPTSHPTVTTASVRLSYNPATLIFTAYYDTTGSADGFQWVPYGSFGVGASGGGTIRNSPWQMTQNLGFKVSVSAFSEGLVVASGSVYADNFSINPPTVTAIAPSSGPTAGGTSVTITGTNFTGATGVTIGGTAATGVTVVNATTITATTPAGSPGTASVVMTTSGGSNSANSLFTYVPAPTVTSIAPASGPVAGGTSVTITGTNFTGATIVTIGGTVTTSVSVVNSTTITCMTPAGTAGTKSVVVTTPSGSNSTNSLFTYVAPAPAVTAISPTSGPTAGGTSVTITGSNFTDVTAVTIDGAAATSVSLLNSTTITCVTPAGTAGAKSVVVTTPSGSNSANSLFTYVAPAPAVTAISPNSGPTSGGTSVTITGSNFTGATAVTIGGAAATSVSVVNSTTITCVTPAGTTGTKSVIVTTPSGFNSANSLFTYVAPAPAVTGISPTNGPTGGGTSVTITGTNFTGAAGVTIGGAAATSVSVINSTTITCVTPAGTAGAKSVVVTTPGGSNMGNFLFTYVAPAPTVTAISPTSGPILGGTPVTITGTNFTNATAVTIGGTAATVVRVLDDTTVTATTPPGTAGAKSVVVTTPSGSNSANSLFTYFGPPVTVTAISPSSGPTGGGTSVTITGTNFTGATAVTIGGAAATGVNVINSTTITCVTPARTAGAKSVVVTTPNGSNDVTNSLFTYVAPAPTVTAIAPAAGPTTGGTSVTITGTNFTGTTAVTIGGAAATSVSVVNSTTITCVTPAGTAGAKSVVVTTPSGSNSTNSLFTYAAPAPAVTAISPTSGPTGGGTSVTIAGTNFTGATAVTIDGSPAMSVSVVNATTITCVTPAGTTGAKSVVVTTPSGFNSANSLFTYVDPAPSVTAISPNSGPTGGGTSVTITGTNFTGTTGVTIGGMAATSVTVVNATTITCATPAHPPGTVSVLVTTPSGTNAANTLYTYLEPAWLGSDNFNDNVRDIARWGAADSVHGGAQLADTNGRLEYRVTTPDGEYDEALRHWLAYVPTNSEAFEAIVDVHNGVTGNNASIGLTVTSLQDARDSLYLELYRVGPDGSGFLAALKSNVHGGDEVPPNTLPSGHGVTDGTVRLAFDPVAKIFTAFYDITGSSDGYQWQVYGSFGVGASGGGVTRNSPWLLANNAGFKISISGFSEGLVIPAGQVYADNFRIQTPVSGPTQQFQSWAASSGLGGEDSDLEAEPFADGVSNLLKYAFNMNASGPDVATMLPGGPGGLPAIAPQSGGPTDLFRFEFVRRIGSGLIYTPQKSSSLQPPYWQPLTDAPTIIPINAEWERVVYEDPYDPFLAPKLFGRVQVSLP